MAAQSAEDYLREHDVEAQIHKAVAQVLRERPADPTSAIGSILSARLDITIVGAGLIGALLGTILQSKGYRVAIYERFDDIRKMSPAGGGRSINLVATARGLRALDVLPDEIKAGMLALGTKVTGRMIHTASTFDEDEPIFQRYGKDDSEFNYSISRLELNKYLLSEAEKAGVAVHFQHRLVDINLEGEFAVLTFETATQAHKVVRCDGPLIAADGGGSAVRATLGKSGLCKFSSERIDSGYKEMTFPKVAAEAHGLARHGLHIWPRGSHMLMGLANLDGSFTGTIYMANEGEESFKSIDDGGIEAAREFLEKHYASALPALGGAENAAKELAANALGFLGTVRTHDWTIGGKVALIGDAAHAIVPFFGQGMNCGFEDVKELVALLEEHAPPGTSAKGYEAAFLAYGEARRPNANAIADMALENYVEMRASTADPEFRLRKAVENALENSALGNRFRSRYAMVCYGGAGGVSYSAAQKLGRVQWEIVCELAKSVSSVETAADELDLTRAEVLLDERLEPLKAELGVDLTKVAH